MSAMITNNVVPVEIGQFFETVYGCNPQITQDKKSTIYSVPEKSISIITDNYGGCHIDIKSIPSDRTSSAQQAIKQLSDVYRISNAYNSIWIDIDLPINGSTIGAIVPPSFLIGEPGKGDLIYDMPKRKLRMWQWLNPNKECAIPPGATHNIGATAIIIDMVAKKVLLVVNKRRSDSWNLPGGSFDPSKDKTPYDTALREAEEEGGFEIEKSAITNARLVGKIQFPDNQFAPAINLIWAIFVDNISNKPLNPPANEIKEAEWVDFEDIQNSTDTLNRLKLGKEIKSPLIAAINGLGFEEISNKKWMIIHAPNFTLR